MGVITKTASDKIAGYIFQFQRTLYRLLRSDASNMIVGIETEDDVVEITYNADQGLNIIFEQDKHTVNKDKNTFQDSSRNLWHSLHIWLHTMESFQSNYSKISFTLVTNIDVNPDSFVHNLSKAKSEKEIKECIKTIKNFALNCVVGTGNAETIKAVAAYPEEKLKFLIENLELGDSNATEDEESLKIATQNLFNLPDDYKQYAEEIYENLMGYMISFCQEQWKCKQPAWIERSKINKRLFQEINIRKIKRFIEKPLMSTSYKEYLQRDNDEHLFLKQLISIGLPDMFCNMALEHYWGFYSEKVRLEDEGDVLPSEWEERNSALYERWKSISVDEETFNSGFDEIELAKRTIHKTLDANYLAPLGENFTTHHYFTRGNYHYLANVEDGSYFVYWHNLFAKRGRNE